MPDSTTQTRKQAAEDFLQLIVAGRIEEAYKKHMDPHGKHHNPFFPAGFPALQRGMAENHSQFPNKRIKIRNVLGDENMVAVHSQLMFKPDEPGMIVVHLFRFEGNKIVELWDCGQQLPGESPNQDGAF